MDTNAFWRVVAHRPFFIFTSGQVWLCLIHWIWIPKRWHLTRSMIFLYFNALLFHTLLYPTVSVFMCEHYTRIFCQLKHPRHSWFRSSRHSCFLLVSQLSPFPLHGQWLLFYHCVCSLFIWCCNQKHSFGFVTFIYKLKITHRRHNFLYTELSVVILTLDWTVIIRNWCTPLLHASHCFLYYDNINSQDQNATPCQYYYKTRSTL